MNNTDILETLGFEYDHHFKKWSKVEITLDDKEPTENIFYEIWNDGYNTGYEDEYERSSRDAQQLEFGSPDTYADFNNG